MASFLQTDEWAAFKSKYGWQTERIDGVLLLGRPLVLGKTLFYAPETELITPDDIRSFLAKIKPLATERQALVFRLEIDLPFSDELAQRMQDLGFIKSFESVQPEWRAVVDLRSSEEQILSAMHPKGRYNVRLAEKRGVKVVQTDNIDLFYDLYSETARRDKFTPRSKAYFVDFLATIPSTQLFIATYEQKPLAAGLIVFYEERAIYLYGASSGENREVMAPYALHWQAIKVAKEKGCTSYDLGEIPPDDAPAHPLHGLRDFKLKFGARPLHLLGSWDFVYQPFWYKVFRIGEKLRRGFRAQ